MAVRCRACGEELESVSTTGEGWETMQHHVYGTVYLGEDGGVIEYEVDDSDPQYTIEADMFADVERYECPQCGHSESLLEDLIEVFDPDAEADEVEDELEDEVVEEAEDGLFHAFLIISAATGKVQSVPWYDTLAEAVKECDRLTNIGGLCVQDAPFISRAAAEHGLDGKMWRGPWNGRVVYVPAKTTEKQSMTWLEGNLASYDLSLDELSGSGTSAAPEGRDELAKIVASLE